MLTVAGIINAIGVTMFLAPVNLYDSGISGTSILLSQISPEFFSLSLFLLLLNIPLFLYGCKKQGSTFTVYAVYSVFIYSLSAYLITDVLPIDVSIASPLAGKDLLLCAIFGGAMDGIEVMAVIFSKKLGITVGTFVMSYNILLYIMCGIILKSWILPLYSIVAYGAAVKTVDFLVEGIDRSKAAMIVTSDSENVCAALSEEFGCGLTILDAKGYYSNTDRQLVYIVLNRFQIPKMRTIVHETDPYAYISVSEVVNVLKGKENIN